MVAILSCQVDSNEVFELVESVYKKQDIRRVGNEYTEFIQLLCIACRQVITIEKKAIKRDGSLWVYV